MGEENHNKRCGKRGRRIHYYCVPCPFGTGGIKAGDKGQGNCYCKKDAVYTRLERTKPKISRNRNVGFFTYSIAGLYGVLVDAMYQECKILRDKSTVWLALGTTGGKSIWRCPVCCLFFSGKYDDLIQPKVGFYTQVSGLGKMPGKSGCIISVW